MKSVKKLFLSVSAVALLGGGITAASAGEAWSPVTPISSAQGMKFASADKHANAETWSPAHITRADLVDTAVSAGQFSTLAKALTEAGLIDTLKGPGPFTVFAPTDAAFAKIPAEQLQALLADKAALTKVLTYHVVPGAVMAKDVSTGPVKTVEGQSLMLQVSNAGVKVNDANVTKTDILASNGVIHVIDTVVLPN
jgi:uncharacterized surface protein with fasciclin (FAS1) repeats